MAVLANVRRTPEAPSRSNAKRSWWLQIILDNLERSSGKDRAARGRSYWRKGAVSKRLTIEDGAALGHVRGSNSERYKVAVGVDESFSAHAEVLANAIASDAACYVDFREGRLNEALMGITLSDGSKLFLDHLAMEGVCNCYDWDATCKHQIALANAIADKIEYDLDLALTFLGIEPNELHALVSQLRDGDERNSLSNDPDNITDTFGWPDFHDVVRFTTVKRYGKSPIALAEHLGELSKETLDPISLIPKNRINGYLGSLNSLFDEMYETVKYHLNGNEEPDF